MSRKDFVAKAAEFKRVLGLALHDERRAAVLAEIEQYMGIAVESNPRFDRDRFRAACGVVCS